MVLARYFRMNAYAELAVTTNYSFLRGASHPYELVATAARLGHAAIGITDRNTLAGVVRAYAALEEIKGNKPRLLVGARLVFIDGTPDILAYPTDRVAYGNLCRLLSTGKLRAPKGECYLTFEDVLKWQEGLLLIVLPPHPLHQQIEEEVPAKAWNEKHSDWKELPDARAASIEGCITSLKVLKNAALDRVWIGLSMLYLGDDTRRLRYWKSVAEEIGVSIIAINDVHYHVPERRMLQDVVTCIRKHVALDTAGRLLHLNAERHLKSFEDMQRLFAEAPEAVAETLHFANRITFTLDQIKYNYPDDPVPQGKTPQQHLEDLVKLGLLEKYGHAVPDKVLATIEKELALIAKMEIAPYFLTVHDIVQFARAQAPKILCQGRGSAANSVVCYVLGITSVNPMEIDLLFERFISQERREPPDIDVDFEHERREEVIQYVYERYGHHRAALTATVICYRPRSAIGDVGKVFGLTEDVTSRMANSVWGSWGRALGEREVCQGALDPQNAVIAQALTFANELIGFPRHLSQHVGGFVLTQDRLDETVPVGPATMENRFFIEWDKDDLDTLKMMKVDVLALGMLTCIRKAFDLVSTHQGETLHLDMKPDRKDVYEMLQNADSIGVFQVESRAQMSMLPRLKPEKFYDLVVQVAIVRPGPIQGDMVHPYLRNRKKQKDPKNTEPIHFPGSRENPNELRDILGKTYGVPLFQEQAMKLAITAAQFSPDEANGLRRAMATFRNVGTMNKFKDKFVGRMVDRGYDQDFAVRCFKQIEGFGSYGFPESHAASFALLVYVSAFLKKHHPAAFAAALLNSQPMGFYAPAEIVRDARERGGVEVRQVDVNFSQWDNTLESDLEGLALRLGFRQVQGFREEWANTLANARGNHFSTVIDLARKTKLPKHALVILAEADSFQSIDMDRREILWAVRRLPDDEDLPLFAASYTEEQPDEDIAPLPVMPLSEHVVTDYQMLRLSLKAHPMFFLRDFFGAEGILSCAEIAKAKDGKRVACAGIVLIRQMPGDAGVVFVTLSDEQGVANVIVWPRLVSVFRREIMGARLMVVEGKVQRGDGDIVHLIAERVFDRSGEMNRLSEDEQNMPSHHAQVSSLHRHPRNVRVMPKSRDFH
jgi:error-prone DNA polymerase